MARITFANGALAQRSIHTHKYIYELIGSCKTNDIELNN